MHIWNLAIANNNFYFLYNWKSYIEYILNDEKVNLLDYASESLKIG